MGLETATFIAGLTPSWPVTSDKKAQGDDHLRLIKSVLQATFPNASKAFYFPAAEISSASQVIDATDNQRTFYLAPVGGNLTATLPALAAADAGWECRIVKSDGTGNAIIVSPPSGTIASQVGTTATIRVGVPWDPVIFNWSGTNWICFKPGALIGATYLFNGASPPPGFLVENGGAYSNTDYAELFAVLGSSTLKDKRGRVDIGAGQGAGLTNRVLGTNYGSETHTIGTANLPPYTPSGSCPHNITAGVHDMRLAQGGVAITNSLSPGMSASGSFGSNVAGAIDINGGVSFVGSPQGGTSTPIDNFQPSVAVNKIIRAC